MPAPLRGIALGFLVVALALLSSWEPDHPQAASVPASWQFLSGEPVARDSAGAAYDSGRARLVLFGGRFRDAPLNDTWEYDGAAWRPVSAAHAPSPRFAHGLVYDARRGRAVLFGGVAGQSILSDTWEYDGTDWIQVSPKVSPTPRVGFAMAYDGRRGRVVLFGGSNTGELNDTWEYDGSTWTQIRTLAAPSARLDHALVYDSARDVVVLFGGLAGLTQLNDTWEYDGTTWRQARPAQSPPGRYGHAMTYDAGRGPVVAFGGSGSDTWEYDGAEWMQVSSPTAPAGHYKPAMAYHGIRGRTVLFGGLVSTSRDSRQTWEFDGSVWSQRVFGLPAPRAGHAIANDAGRGRLVVFGGRSDELGTVNETWELDGSTWLPIATASAPAPRFNQTMAYDGRRGRTVLFGGLVPASSGALNYSDETWEYDGATWRPVAPATSPSARVGQGMAFDAGRGVVVLFGGFDGRSHQYLNDTWEYDGAAWTARRIPNSPPAGLYPAMAYDVARGVVVAFGGFGGETWEYNGRRWRQIAVESHPSGGGWLALDPGRGVSVLSAGYDPRDPRLSRFWEYNGGARAWTQADTTSLPIGRAAPIAYDSASTRIVLFGGHRLASGTMSFNETWVYGPPRPTR
jgi:hypothetical protein